jgi:glucose-6-phosphate 1-dehydrogenase
VGLPVQIVIFGASGDLAMGKLLPALANIVREKKGGDFVVVGAGRRAKTDTAFRAEVETALGTGAAGLAARLYYQQADASDAKSMLGLARRLQELAQNKPTNRLFYFSIKPELFGPTVAQLGAASLVQMDPGQVEPWRRVVIEKPFGHDFASALELSQELGSALREEQIYRIDHYLGKETVQNILGLRFHNAIFEPLWNREHVEFVQITVAEDIGVQAGRADYYDTTGALRDVVQNHMLQLLALVAMEAPSSLHADVVRTQKVSVLEALHLPTPAEVRDSTVRARYRAGTVDGKQFPAYVDEEGVPAGSTAETYAAVRVGLDTWRWGGVPFLLRHGKRLPKRFTDIQIHFKKSPLALFNRPDGVSEPEFRRLLRSGELTRLGPNVLCIAIQPRERISLSFGVKQPGQTMLMSPAKLEFDYASQFGTQSMPAYERLLLEAMAGDATLFLRADEISASWRYADAVRAGWTNPEAPPLLEYAAGTWGPACEQLFRNCEGQWSRG